MMPTYTSAGPLFSGTMYEGTPANTGGPPGGGTNPIVHPILKGIEYWTWYNEGNTNNFITNRRRLG